MYKYLLILFLILSLVLPGIAKPNYTYTLSPINNTSNNQTGTYINNEITTPITQIGVYEKLIKQEDKEKGLEIEWNEWHARVRNKIMNDMGQAHLPLGTLYYFIYTVHKNGEISNIITAQFVENDSELYKITINNHEKPRFDCEYAVSMKKEQDKNYKTYIYNIGNYNLSTKDGVLIDALKVSSFKKNATLFDKPYRTKQIAERIEKIAKDPILKFPQNSKRDKVVVYQTMAIGLDIPEFKTKFNASDFYDIETQR